MTKLELGEHFDRYVREAVASGRYANESEVIRAALALHESHATDRDVARAALRRELEAGLADADAGRLSTPTRDELLREARKDK